MVLNRLLYVVQDSLCSAPLPNGMVVLGEATAIAAGCSFAAGWLLRTCQPHRDEPAFTEPPQPTATHSSVRGQYNVFISHARAQKDFALWVRSHVRICGYRAFVDERDLRCESARD